MLQLANQIAQMQGQQNQLQNQLNASYSQQQPNLISIHNKANSSNRHGSNNNEAATVTESN